MEFMSTVEQNTRYIVDTILKNEGWILDINDQNKNVFFETDIFKIGQCQTLKNSKLRPDYVLIDKNRNPIAVIETKGGGKDLNKALEQAEQYAILLAVPFIFAMNNEYCQTKDLRFNKPLIIDNQEVTQLLNYKLLSQFIIKNSNEIYTVEKKIITSRKELVHVFSTLNDDLRSEGIRVGIDRFSEFANVLFLKLYCEEKPEINEYWYNLKKTSNAFLIDTFNKCLDKFNSQYKTDIFYNSKIQNPETLKSLINSLDKLTLSTIDTDIKGDAFEYFLQTATSSNNDLGEYFTPRHIVNNMVQLVNLKFKETVYDPFCGTGGFLTQAFRYIKENNILSKEEMNILKEQTFFGGEITSNARLCKMNMILQGDGHSGINQINSLANPVHNKYDCIITNMPFSQKIVKKIWNEKKHQFEEIDFISRLYNNNLGKKSGDGVCMLHCFNALKKGGRMAIVVPEGVLSRRVERNVRQHLIKNSTLKCVIALPKGVFLPYTSIRTSILYFDDCHNGRTKDVLFYDVQNDGFSLDCNREKIKENDLRKISYNFINGHNFDDYKEYGFKKVNIQDIKKNDYKLIYSIYNNDSTVEKSKWDMVFLKDVCDYEQPKQYIVQSTRYRDFYKTPVLTAGKSFILGYTDEKENIYDQYPVILFDDFTTSIQYVDFPFKVKSSALKILKNKNNIDIHYLYYVLKGIQFDHSTHKRYWISEYSKMKIPLPPLDIQKKIVNKIIKKQNTIKKYQDEIIKYEHEINEEICKIWEAPA
nr:hypothetical protein [Caulerpa lentillifera]